MIKLAIFATVLFVAFFPQVESACGDGVIDPDETCDTGTVASKGCWDCQVRTGWDCTGTPSVCSEACGNGVITISEDCDDGNTDSGDGCSAGCITESGWACRGKQSVCWKKSDVAGTNQITYAPRFFCSKLTTICLHSPAAVRRALSGARTRLIRCHRLLDLPGDHSIADFGGNLHLERSCICQGPGFRQLRRPKLTSNNTTHSSACVLAQRKSASSSVAKYFCVLSDANLHVRFCCFFMRIVQLCCCRSGTCISAAHSIQ